LKQLDLTKLDRRGTKFTSKINSEISNKSFEHIDRSDNMWDDNKITFKALQEKVKSKDDAEKNNDNKEIEKYEEDKEINSNEFRSNSMHKHNIFDESSEDKDENSNNEDDGIELRKVKINGWKWPLHLYQISTWALGVIETVYLFGEVYPYFEHVYGLVILILCYVGFSIPLLILDIMWWISDPTDPVIYNERIIYQKLLQQNTENTQDLM